MKKILCITLWIAALVAATTPARAEESSSSDDTAEQRPRWAVDLSPGWTWIGHGRQTGGLTPQASVWRSWRAGERFDLAIGGDIAAFGFGAGGHWFAVLTGPAARAAWHPPVPLTVELDARLDVGRLPTCNAWRPSAFCMNFWGWFPSFGAAVVSTPRSHVSAVLGGDVRVIRTWLWSGPSVSLHAGARFSW